jgi:hypothetical protein
MGTHGEYVVAMPAEANEGKSLYKTKAFLCPQSAPLVLRSHTAISWRQNYVSRQEHEDALAEEKREQVVAAKEILKNR